MNKMLFTLDGYIKIKTMEIKYKHKNTDDLLTTVTHRNHSFLYETVSYSINAHFKWFDFFFYLGSS